MTCKDEGSTVVDTQPNDIRRCPRCYEETKHIIKIWSCGDMERVCLECGRTERI